MRTARTSVRIAAWLGFLLLSTPTFDPGVLAAPQAPQVPQEGVYSPEQAYQETHGCNRPDLDGQCWEKIAMPDTLGSKQLVIRGREYVLAGKVQAEKPDSPLEPLQHSEYWLEGRRKGTYLQLCHLWGGWFTLSSPLKLKNQDLNSNTDKLYQWKYAGGLGAVKDTEALFRKKLDPCENKPETKPSAAVVPGVGRSLGVFSLTLAAVESSWFVDGELIVRLEDKYVDADREAWSCLVLGNYPSLRLNEGGQSDLVYVRPDAHFRTEVRGGVTYGWRLDPTRCIKLATEPATGTLVVPPTHGSAPEKIVVICFLHAGHFDRCEAKYLVRP